MAKKLVLIILLMAAAAAHAQIPGDRACDGENGPPPPYCRRFESCDAYYARLNGPCTNTDLLPSGKLCEYRMWEKWWCTISGGRCDRTTSRRSMRPYFSKHLSGCSCPGTGISIPIVAGKNHPCWAPDPLIFDDNFETGDLTKWSKVK